MNLKSLQSNEATKGVKAKALSELHKTFASLTQEEQRYANIFLHDVQRGDVVLEDGRTLLDYIIQYQEHAKTIRYASLR